MGKLVTVVDETSVRGWSLLFLKYPSSYWYLIVLSLEVINCYDTEKIVQSIMIFGQPRAPAQIYQQNARRPRDRNTASKRGRYVSNAWCALPISLLFAQLTGDLSSVNCQKRKVKCTGEGVCQQCRAADLSCTYNLDKKRRKVIETKDDSPKPATRPADDSLDVAESLHHMMTRISDLERDCRFLRAQLRVSQERADPYPRSRSVPPSDVEDDLEGPIESTFQGPTNIMNPIGVLNNSVIVSDGSPTRSMRTEDPVPQSALNWREISRVDARVMEAAERDTNLQDTARLGPIISRFFEEINPYYPSVNENEFRSQLADVVGPARETQVMSKPDRYQFVALINLIIAEVLLLSDEWTEGEAVPGWANFWRAERILGRLVWQGNGNRLTVQCLIIKGRYLMNLEHGSAAHETICRAVRLCFQMGFHDMSSWTNCSPFETVMRQRIFWTVFYLERSVALNSGYPYITREVDIKVDHPAAYDDRELFPNQPLPTQTAEERSYAPNLLASIKWSRLTGEIWDAMFAANHPPIEPEFLPSMDARIMYNMTHLPTMFRTSSTAADEKCTAPSPFSRHQSVIQRLRHQQLRLLLRQESLLTLEYDDATALDTQEIISSTLQMLQVPQEIGDCPVGRLAVVFYIVVTLLPLICLINGRRSTKARPHAASCFRTELEMLQQLAPSVGMARHVLSHMQDIITATKSVIQASHVSSGDAHPYYAFPKSMEPSAFMPVEPLQGQDGLDNMIDELLGDSSLLDLVAMPEGTNGFWAGDAFTQQWMQV
ncbi:fungal-specific transcription factor domain-containing protein [Aspergillus sergii]|uniref:Fungal-specific transcription factor domain-containing protein n=1 Tax=Aspergillus sergii TaxID=1034303 RepID=A0A5N6XF51_9EURO|nr:fungal-specific transcription factor domain-containing protein [Aspergillus sergii]